MTRYSAATLHQIWLGGISLKEALAQFDGPIDKFDLVRRARQIRSSSATAKRNWRAAGVDADIILDSVGTAQLHLAAATDARTSQVNQFLAALESGELVAIGYSAAKGAATKLELVPPFLFRRQFARFGKSEFRDGEHRFANVRIAPATRLGKPKVGRPTIREHVFEIASAIEDQITGLRPGEQAAMVHRHGLKLFPGKFSKTSPTPRAIDRHLKAYWKTKLKSRNSP